MSRLPPLPHILKRKLPPANSGDVGDPAGDAGNLITYGALQYDASAGTVILSGRLIELSQCERRLLVVLMQHRQALASKEALLKLFTSPSEAANHTALEVCMHRLRKKIEQGGFRIITVRGLGYGLVFEGRWAAPPE